MFSFVKDVLVDYFSLKFNEKLDLVLKEIRKLDDRLTKVETATKPYVPYYPPATDWWFFPRYINQCTHPGLLRYVGFSYCPSCGLYTYDNVQPQPQITWTATTAPTWTTTTKA